ncbi:hypothetical protein ACIPUN_03100 [Pectobacterium sp. CHL-2024]|uniref:hypothetical protein n=1 Tax=Pectobacterium sp. CHL-2024 TaxID=3377079 RepID=UPI003818E2B1
MKMMIEIKLKNKRVLSSSFNTNEIYSAIIMFSIYHALRGRCKSVKINYIHFSFDCVIKNITLNDHEYVGPWSINPLLKPLIIMLCSYGFLSYQNKPSGLEIKITDAGNTYVEEMINEGLFLEINVSTQRLAQSLTLKKLDNQKLIW